jgi:hypothetical protein
LKVWRVGAFFGLPVYPPKSAPEPGNGFGHYHVVAESQFYDPFLWNYLPTWDNLGDRPLWGSLLKKTALDGFSCIKLVLPGAFSVQSTVLVSLLRLLKLQSG